MPTAEDYKSNQVDEGLVPESAIGGLYYQGYMHVGTGLSASQVFQAPVTYHGAPFGAFRRAFAVLGLPGVQALSVHKKQQLMTLKIQRPAPFTSEQPTILVIISNIDGAGC